MKTILIVDDDQPIARLMARVLQIEGLAVEQAHSGEEGLAHLADGHVRPDLILLDLSMPGISGREFFRRARDKAGFKGPILLCSAYGASSAKRELGADGAIEKPFEPDELVAAVKSHLHASGARVCKKD